MGQEEPVPAEKITDAVAEARAERDAELERRKRGMHHVSVNHAIAVLNSMLVADPAAVADLIEKRVPCNQALADHPTIQVMVEGETTQHYAVGFLGVLNGIFGVADPESQWGYIVAHYDEAGLLDHFDVLEP